MISIGNIIDGVFHSVKCLGVERNRDDLCGLILYVLANDVAVNKTVKSR